MFHRQGHRGRLPRDCVGVSAAVAGAAVEAVLLDSDFHGWERRILSELFGHDLINRDAYVDTFLLWMGAAEKNSGGAGMVGARIAADAGGLRMRQVAYYDQAISIFLQRLQNLGELEAFALLRGRPLVHCGAVRDIDASEPSAGIRRRLCQ